MNKKLRVTLALLVTLLLCVQVLAGCSKNDENNSTSTTTSSQSNSEGDDNTEVDDPNQSGFFVSKQKENIPDDAWFDNRDFTFLIENPVEKTWTYTNMVVEEDTAEAIDSAFYTRNLLVEERLGIKIKQVTTSYTTIQSKFKTSVTSQDGSFDAAMVNYGAASKLAVENLCVNYEDLPYVDLSKPWWDKGSIRDLSIGGQNYLVASDISICDNDNTWIIYFDKAHVQDYGLDVPYDLVKSGKWTMDKMLEMMKVVAEDLDNNGLMNSLDRFGFITHAENVAASWLACGETIIKKDSDDYPYLDINTERFSNIWEKIKLVMNDQSCKVDIPEVITTGLRDGKTLFGTEILKFMRDYRVNDRDFGVVPMPKYDEQQENYHTYVALSAPLLVVPTSNNELESTSIILEAMAAEGHRTIMPAYYTVSIDNKFARDIESTEMLNIAFDTRLYDLGVVFNWGNIKDTLTSAYKGSTGISAIADTYSTAVTSAIEKTYSAFEK